MRAIRYAREQAILGICLGMQLAVVGCAMRAWVAPTAPEFDPAALRYWPHLGGKTARQDRAA